MIQPAVERFLADHKHGVLATVRKDGRPQLSMVLCVYEEGKLIISITETRAKYRNLVRDPRATFLIVGDSAWQYVVVSGTVSFVHWPEARQGLRAYYEKASGPHPDWEEYDRAMEEEKRVLATLAIDHVDQVFNVSG